MEAEFTIIQGKLIKYHGAGGHVVIPDGVTSIGEHAFQDCRSLKGVTIPDSVQSIERGAFFACKNLKQVQLPKGLCGVGKNAFEYTPWIDQCGPLELVIPEGTTEIAANAFEGLSHAARKQLLQYENSYRMTGREVPERPVKEMQALTIRRVVIPASVRRIGQGAFRGCQIKQLILSEGLESIGAEAFKDCSILNRVVLPDSVTELGENAFAGCGDKLMILGGEKVFAKLEQAVRERTVAAWLKGKLTCTPAQEKPLRKYVGRTRNTWVKKLKGDQAEQLANILDCGKPTLEQINSYMDMFTDGKHPQMMAMLLEFRQVHFPQEDISRAEDQRSGFEERTLKDWEMLYRLQKGEDGYTLLKYKGIDRKPEIPMEIEGVPVCMIGRNAFKGNIAIEELEVPGSISIIGDSAFEACTALKHLHFHEGLKHIGKRAFAKCTELAGDIVLPEGLLDIGGSAFYAGGYEEHKHLKSIHVPASMAAFDGAGLEGYIDLYLYGMNTALEPDCGFCSDTYDNTIYVRRGSKAEELLRAMGLTDMVKYLS
ncbi:MAG: leucine-rich repeat domain-containing protein [Aristaeellaceae bacterium]